MRSVSRLGPPTRITFTWGETMATLLLDRADLEVRITDGALALYEGGTRRQTVPLRLIDRVVIQGARTRLDSAVLIKLAEAGAATLLLSPRAGRQVAIVLGPAHNDAAVVAFGHDHDVGAGGTDIAGLAAGDAGALL